MTVVKTICSAASVLVAVSCLILASSGTLLALPQAPLGSPLFLGQSTASVLEYMGWDTESHEVPSNGYYISLTRMINPLANQSAVRRAVVFAHGITQDSINAFLSFAHYVRPEAPTSESYSTDVYANVTSDGLGLLGEATEDTYRRLCFPCVFSNNNYDVWIEDGRGVSRASEQVYRPELKESQRYWNFSIDQLALEDLPNVIDYVLNATQLNKLTYVGFSLGTLRMNMLLSDRPEYAGKLAAYVGMAPVAYASSIKGLFRTLVLFESLFRQVNAPTLYYDQMVALNAFISTSCKPPLVRTSVCRGLLNLIVGPDLQNNVATELFSGHGYAPNSLKTFAQIAQFIRTNQLRHFDFGTAKQNEAAYGQPEPPTYDTSRIQLDKIILVRSAGNDWLSVKEDHEQFIATLKVPLFRDIVVPPVYNHYSYHLARDAFTNVLKPALQTVNKAYQSG